MIIWVCDVLNGRLELYNFECGSVISNPYGNKLILPHVLLYQGATGSEFIFVDDNTKQYRTWVIYELLENERITRMEWLADFPDVNPM